MAYALNEEYNGPLRTLIIVDISPARGKISPEWVLNHSARLLASVLTLKVRIVHRGYDRGGKGEGEEQVGGRQNLAEG
jgi:hypothetical protein